MLNVAVLFADHTSSKGYLAPNVSFVGHATTRFGAPQGFAQWIVVGSVLSGSSLEWSSALGDEGIYIERGRVEVDGEICESGGAVIVERGASALLQFVEDTQVVHLGQSIKQPSKRLDGSHPAIHVINPVVREYAERNLKLYFYTDGSCPGCDIVLFRIAGTAPHIEGSHRHTADELIYVLEGALQVGRNHIEAGMTIAVPANRLYGFRTLTAWEYVNYRPAVCETFSRTGELYTYS